MKEKRNIEILGCILIIIAIISIIVFLHIYDAKTLISAIESKSPYLIAFIAFIAVTSILGLCIGMANKTE